MFLKIENQLILAHNFYNTSWHEENESEKIGFLEALKKNFKFLHSLGFRIRFFNPYSNKGKKVVENYQSEFLMTFFETLNSQGSLYTHLFLESSNGLKFDPSVFELKFIQDILGNLGCIMEVKIDGNQNLSIR